MEQYSYCYVYLLPSNDEYVNVAFIGQYLRTDYRFNLSIETVVESSFHAVQKLVINKNYKGESLCKRIKKVFRFLYTPS